jgi:hypothetical protein
MEQSGCAKKTGRPNFDCPVVRISVEMIRLGKPNMRSNFAGWTLAEAAQRTTGSPDDKDSQLWMMVEDSALVAFGRRHTQSDREWMSAATCQSLIKRDLNTSSAYGLNVKDQSFVDILIYPVLHAPNVVDFLEGMSLKDAFWQFVLRDPEVLLLGTKAIKADPDLKRVYQEGWCYPSGCREWPVAFDQGDLAGGRSPNSPIGYLADPPPQEVQQAANIICLRYGSLLKPLRHEKLEAIGDPVRSRGTDRVLPSIWSHSSYCFDPTNGDMLQTNEASAGEWHDIRLKRWRAVMLRRPSRPKLFHVKPSEPDRLLPPTAEPQRASGIPRRATTRIETTTSSLKACREWLIEIMEASREKRTESKQSLWNRARDKWPGSLSERSFFQARTDAIRISRARAWGAAGAPRKSQRQSPR